MVICQGVDINNTSIKLGCWDNFLGPSLLDLTVRGHQAVTGKFVARGRNEHFCLVSSIILCLRSISALCSLINLMAMALSDGVNTTGENRRRILRRFLARKNKKGAIKGTIESCKIV